jgi:hypothetical protein
MTSHEQRRLRLARRLARTIDSVLAVVEASRHGQLQLVADREEKLVEAAEDLAELLGQMRLRGHANPAPVSVHGSRVTTV